MIADLTYLTLMAGAGIFLGLAIAGLADLLKRRK